MAKLHGNLAQNPFSRRHLFGIFLIVLCQSSFISATAPDTAAIEGNEPIPRHTAIIDTIDDTIRIKRDQGYQQQQQTQIIHCDLSNSPCIIGTRATLSSEQPNPESVNWRPAGSNRPEKSQSTGRRPIKTPKFRRPLPSSAAAASSSSSSSSSGNTNNNFKHHHQSGGPKDTKGRKSWRQLIAQNFPFGHWKHSSEDKKVAASSHQEEEKYEGPQLTKNVPKKVPFRPMSYLLDRFRSWQQRPTGRPAYGPPPPLSKNQQAQAVTEDYRQYDFGVSDFGLNYAPPPPPSSAKGRKPLFKNPLKAVFSDAQSAGSEPQPDSNNGNGNAGRPSTTPQKLTQKWSDFVREVLGSSAPVV